MADRFSETLSFLRIADAGNLSLAAQRLGLSLASISRRLAQLEARLGVPLVRRNSRHLTLTEEGRIFYEKAGQAILQLEDAEQAVMRQSVDATGELRVMTTVNFGRRRLAPLLQNFATLNPDVKVHLETSDQITNVVQSGFDMAICFQQPPDSRLMMRRLADNPRVMCAAPDYLERRGRPSAVHELTGHDCIAIGSFQQDAWRHVDLGDGRPRHALSTNDGELARLWALDGAGVVIKSLWDVADDLEAGRLEQVLRVLTMPASPIVALHTMAQGESAKVRLCVRFLMDNLRRFGPVTAPISVAA